MQASQELELQRQLFPKVMTPGEARQSLDGAKTGNDSSSGSGSSSSGESGSSSDSSSGSESDDESSEDEKESRLEVSQAGTALGVRPLFQVKDASADTLLTVNGISSALKRIQPTAAAAPTQQTEVVAAAATQGKATPAAKGKTPKKTPAKAAVPFFMPSALSAPATATVEDEVIPATTPAAGGKGGRGGGRGAGKAGRGTASTPGAPAAGGRGGRGGSKRRDIDPNLLRSMIAGTSTVSASSLEGANNANNGGAGVVATPAVKAVRKRKTVSEGPISSPLFGPTGTQVKAKKPKVVAPVVAVAPAL